MLFLSLREKREILLERLSENICEESASYATFNQGSYAMGTGIKPEGDDYDIDVGIVFDINKEDYPNPVNVKKWVRDALEGHTKNIQIRNSCVTVSYQKENEPIYHVDFAIYAGTNIDGKLYIAKGKEFSVEDNKIWEVSDPKGLIAAVKDKHGEDDSKQFRRVIRYLKKWKTHNFSSNGNESPSGIGITILAFHLFSVVKTYDWAKKNHAYDDFSALDNLVKLIRDSFTHIWNFEDMRSYYTISASLPVEPFNKDRKSVV